MGSLREMKHIQCFYIILENLNAKEVYFSGTAIKAPKALRK